MTNCSDDEQNDDSSGQPRRKSKRSKGGKHVCFPPDEQLVSSFAEHGNAEKLGELLFK